jgi:hypothetical protein
VPGLNVPVPLVVQVTVPAGVLAVPESVSDTVTVHVDPTFTCGGGAQLTDVAVVRTATDRVDPPELTACLTSPPYEAVTVWLPPTAGL